MRTETPSTNHLMTIRSAAEARGLDPRCLWRAIREGQLKAYKIDHRYRVRLQDVDSWIEGSRYEPNSPGKSEGSK